MPSPLAVALLGVLLAACGGPDGSAKTGTDAGTDADTDTDTDDGGGDDAGHDTGDLFGPTTIHAAQGRDRGIVEVDLPVGATAQGLQIRVERGGTWEVACTDAARCVLAGPADRVDARTPDDSLWAEAVVPDTVEVSITTTRHPAGFWADEEPTFTIDRSSLPPLFEDDLQLSLQRRDTGQWWSPTGAAWTDTPEAIERGQASPHVASTDPQVVPLRAVLGLSPEGADLEERGDVGDEALLALDADSVDVVALGRQLMWGDTHAHSDLSHDGCANPDDDCANTADDVGWGFFGTALDLGLQFSAMTDHAEWLTWQATPDSTETVDIWQRQQDVVAEATEDSSTTGFVPVLGYEWTHDAVLLDDGHYQGGHRTVLLEDPGACSEVHIAADLHSDDTSTTKLSDGQTFTDRNPVVASSSAQLYEAFDTAIETCGIDSRIISIAHHPAWALPSPVDWAHPANAPDPRYEMLVEIYSEHGASECTSLDAPWCDWHPKLGEEHVPTGSIQTALAAGFRFGFVGGTDSHDARPGSIDDGPSCPAFYSTTGGGLLCHYWNGALTGVLAAAPADRAALFDGMAARNTYATSGPLLPVRAWVLDAAGAVHLPGDALPAGAGITMVVSLEEVIEYTDFERVEVDLLDSMGTLLQSHTGPTWELDLEVLGNDVRYLRLRLYEPGDDEGERIWISPWYFDIP